MKRQYHKEYLTREELTAFLKAKLSSEHLEKVRDVFVFSCFTFLALVNNSLIIRTLKMAIN